MKNKLVIILSAIGITFGSVLFALAAPNTTYQTNILPIANQTYDLGTTTPALEWKNLYTKNLTVSGTCTGCGSGSIFAWTPQSWGNSTSTTLGFLNGFLSTASSTISGVLQATGGIIGNVTGSASTLSPGRNINGTLFDGSTNITITAASSTLLADTNTWSSTGTTTFNGNQYVKGNLQVDGKFFAPVTLVSSGNATINGALTVTGQTTLATSLTGLAYTSSGIVSAITNGTIGTTGVLGLSGGVPAYVATSTLYGTGTAGQALAWLNGVPTWSATTTFTGTAPVTTTLSNGQVTVACATCLTANQSITLSGVVTGTGATAITTAFGSQTAGVLGNAVTGNTAPMATSTLYGTGSYGQVLMNNSGLQLTATSSLYTMTGTGLMVLNNAPTFTGLVTMSTASTTSQLSIDPNGRLYIPANANPTINSTGDLAINTTSASSSLRYFDGTAERSLFPDGTGGLPFASSTLAYLGAYGASGTTTMVQMRFYRPASLLNFYCDTDVGTAYVTIGNGTASTTGKCTAGGTYTTSSVTWTMGQAMFIGVGTQTTNPNLITVSPSIRKDAD